ncbi:MAG: hypothetical protein GWN07_02310, partial [Actinobacteria bacterium]|nr:hypothetical protein [Actinomycetota bacterium]NIX18732.1 hypothetical protein [Actinomycetota bacterium]
SEGKTVWKDSLGVWHSSLSPYQGGSTTTTHDGGTTTVEGPDEGLATAEHVFLGGHVYTVDSSVAAELVAAGFGDNLEWAISLDGSSGTFVHTPDAVGFHPSSELDVRVEFTPAGQTFAGLAGQWGTSGQFSWNFQLPSQLFLVGGPEYGASENGTSSAGLVRGPVNTKDTPLVRQTYRMVHDLGTG